MKRVAKATGVAVTDVNLPARLSKEQKGEIQDLIEDNNDMEDELDMIEIP